MSDCGQHDWRLDTKESNHDWKHLIPNVPQAVNLCPKGWLKSQTKSQLFWVWRRVRPRVLQPPIFIYYHLVMLILRPISIHFLPHFPVLSCLKVSTKIYTEYGNKTPSVTYQELWGAEDIQSEGLDPGVVDSQLSVDPWTFNTGQDAQVGGQPRRVWAKKKRKKERKESHYTTLITTILYHNNPNTLPKHIPHIWFASGSQIIILFLTQSVTKYKHGRVSCDFRVITARHSFPRICGTFHRKMKKDWLRPQNRE